MGKVDTNKKIKKNALFQTAFELFSDKGFSKTTIADIVSRAGLAKGTFYLYFKDKYDLRDKLIAHKAAQLFVDAHQALVTQSFKSFEEQVFAMIDYIVGRLEEDHGLLQFITKNLSWGIFRSAFSSPVSDAPDSVLFYEYFMEQMKKSSVSCEEPELLLFTIIELVGSSCYSCILYEEPVSMQQYLPYLHKSVHQILSAFTIS